MVNKYFELERLKSTLQSRGLEDKMIAIIISKAEAEIDSAASDLMSEAMDKAITMGVEKDSADFINQLRPSATAFHLETQSGSTDFSDPPFPMLPRLLQNAKPIKDGSGVYKVIPVGGRGKPKPSIASNIFDAQKAVQAARAESAKQQYNTVTPSGSVKFRTATSKQDPSTSWVMPAKEKDFSEGLSEINANLEEEIGNIVLDVIRNYEESF